MNWSFIILTAFNGYSHSNALIRPTNLSYLWWTKSVMLLKKQGVSSWFLDGLVVFFAFYINDCRLENSSYGSLLVMVRFPNIGLQFSISWLRQCFSRKFRLIGRSREWTRLKPKRANKMKWTSCYLSNDFCLLFLHIVNVFVYWRCRRWSRRTTIIPKSFLTLVGLNFSYNWIIVSCFLILILQ